MRVAFSALLLLTACTAPPPSAPPGPAVPPPGQDSCGAGPYGRLVGQDATALERELILRQVRVIRPGDAITMDVRTERINFDIGADGAITRIWCG